MIDPLNTPSARSAQQAAAELHERVFPLADDALDLLFRSARSHNGWTSEPVTEATIRQLYELLRWGPTSMNCCPARFVFLRSDAAKARLKPALAPGNIEKAMPAPVIVIVAQDEQFTDALPELYPHRDVTDRYVKDPAHAHETMFRNATLQGAYLMIAARALGIDCGPMSGFKASLVDAEFFTGTSWRANFLCGLGRGNTRMLYQRLPRLSFEQACRLL